MNATRNRSAGFNWEREGVKDFAKLYPEVKTSRQVSRTRDAEKVDLAYPDEIKYGRFPYNAQYKSYTSQIRYPLILDEMPKDSGAINVVMHKQTVKSGTKFMTKGKYAIMAYEDFFRLAAWRLGYEIVMNYISDECGFRDEGETLRKLEQIGL